jgi:hypothetical protein
MTSATLGSRVERLSAASARRIIDPDRDLPGALGDGQIVADELLSVRDLGLDLTPEQRRRLAAEQIGAITDEGIRFESVLDAGFSFAIMRAPDLTAPWVTYALHEVGEETRHSRMFVRLLGQLRPTAVNPFHRGVPGWIRRRVINRVVQVPPLFFTLVLAGEEIPDLFQKRVSEHPATDPFLAEVNRYHRQEEARHLAFARLRLPELWAAAPRRQRAAVRRLAPFVVRRQYEGLLHPGIYGAVGLPAWRTWAQVHRSPFIEGLLAEACRPILAVLVGAGALQPGRIPRGWRRLCAVDRAGNPQS